LLAECERSQVCRQRLYFAKGWRVWRERRHVRTSGGSISIVGNGIAYNGRVLLSVAAIEAQMFIKPQKIN